MALRVRRGLRRLLGGGGWGERALREERSGWWVTFQFRQSPRQGPWGVWKGGWVGLNRTCYMVRKLCERVEVCSQCLGRR